ncbi:transketolase [Lachnospiraceae bacterium MD335]|nr:transketolase [Lachnospiraceae bacterium MD335]
MRTTFIETLTDMAREDEKIMCVIGDTGFSVFEAFEEEFGSRFLNVGIAEQNFVSIGAGLAAMGMKPYIYNVVSFMTLRATEQILLDVCYQENPVVLVGVGGGFAYANAGPTHHALQDIAIMSSLPNMTVVCPGDPVEMRAVMQQSKDYGKPLYIRIGRSVDPVVHQHEIDFEIGKAIEINEGTDATIFVTGVMLQEAVKVRELLFQKGISAAVYSMPTVKPIDEKTVKERVALGKPVFTMEEHSTIGGLGDAVGRVLCENMTTAPIYFHKFGVNDQFAPVTGSREYLRNLFGISANKMAELIAKVIDGK